MLTACEYFKPACYALSILNHQIRYPAVLETPPRAFRIVSRYVLSKPERAWRQGGFLDRSFGIQSENMKPNMPGRGYMANSKLHFYAYRRPEVAVRSFQ